MLKRLILLFALCVTPALAEDEQVVLGLSHDRVAITATFDGSEILIFGAVKRETPIPSGPPLEVVVAVAGPSSPVMVRRKERKLGIWVNTDSVLVDLAPSFYAVATSAPLDDILSDTDKWKRWDRIEAEYPPIIVGRQGYEEVEGSLQFPGVSSTEIRRRVEAGLPIDHLLGAEVARLVSESGAFSAG